MLAPHSISRHPGFWGIKDSQVAAEAYEELLEGTSPERVSDSGESTPHRSPAQILEGLTGRFIKKDINFMGVRKILLSVSAFLVVASVAVVGIKGLDFGIEFVGGTSVSFHNAGDVSIEQMREAFNDAGEPDAVVQTTTTDGTEGFLIRTTSTSAEDAASVATQVANELNLSASSYEVSTIGPDWGAGVIQSSLIAFFVSILLIIAYIAFRFEYKMGIMAVLALIHDLIIVVGVYALFGREITPNTIAALLTILGYSLYDTVVVFHRISDNMRESKVKCTFMSMANHSLNQVFVRTINTTLTSFIPVLGMLLFGGETLKDFAFAMTVGLLAGSYSSIAVATPLFSIWKSREPKYAKLAKKYGSAITRFTFASTPLLASAAVAEGQTVANESTVSAGEQATTSKDSGSAKASANKKKSSKGGNQQHVNYHYRRKKK